LLAQGENYGYQIVQSLARIPELAVNESTVYPILARLEKEGHLRIRVAPSPGGPPRRYFALTQQGQTYTRELNAYWDALGAAVAHLRSGVSGGTE